MSFISLLGDPNAFDITMSDEDRMALMLMVKEGKITTQHAIEVVSFFGETACVIVSMSI